MRSTPPEPTVKATLSSIDQTLGSILADSQQDVGYFIGAAVGEKVGHVATRGSLWGSEENVDQAADILFLGGKLFRRVSASGGHAKRTAVRQSGQIEDRQIEDHRGSIPDIGVGSEVDEIEPASKAHA